MKNFKRNGLFASSVIALASPLFFQGTVINVPLDSDEVSRVVFRATEDTETARSTVFDKKDLNALVEIGSDIEILVKQKTHDSRIKTYFYFYSAFVSALVLAAFALLHHEPENPY